MLHQGNFHGAQGSDRFSNKRACIQSLCNITLPDQDKVRVGTDPALNLSCA